MTQSPWTSFNGLSQFLHAQQSAFELRDVSGIALNNYLLYGVGAGQVLTFVLHPFQPGLALTSLAIGVAAIIVHGKRADLAGKLAVVLAASIIGYAAPAEHIYQMLVRHDFTANSVSLPLVMAIVTSTLGIEFVICQAIARQAIVRPSRAVPSELPEQLPDGGRAAGVARPARRRAERRRWRSTAR